MRSVQCQNIHVTKDALDESDAEVRRRGSLLKGALAGVAVVLGLLLGWLIVTGVLAALAANDVRTESSSLVAAFKTGDTAQVATSLAELQESADTLDSRLNQRR